SGFWRDQQSMSGYFASPTLELFGELVQARVVDSLDLHTFGSPCAG
ncbi:antibiotic biosynthesis monooxygenase, partial [Pseudomonas frederiksbergensis]|nr:antibiotic biosynthesis monooxygenase [Pseudomonas frederiksbergensis]